MSLDICTICRETSQPLININCLDKTCDCSSLVHKKCMNEWLEIENGKCLICREHTHRQLTKTICSLRSVVLLVITIVINLSILIGLIISMSTHSFSTHLLLGLTLICVFSNIMTSILICHERNKSRNKISRVVLI